ncbi:hypothetical protein ACIBP6_05525 [Nonomuraea terrae]|uniref:hypothetical protein n=1 Tax=Nonomuraea terrae TaxID=2530383 RepID=UPI0037A949E8
MASDDLAGTNRKLMWVEYPARTHLSESSTPGGSSALVRDDDNALVTQAVLFPADYVIKAVAAVGVAVGVAMGIVAVKGTPHVKNRFNDLKSKLNRKSADTIEAPAQEARPEQSDDVVIPHPTLPTREPRAVAAEEIGGADGGRADVGRTRPLCTSAGARLRPRPDKPGGGVLA